MGSSLDQMRAAIAAAINGMSRDDLLRHAEGKWCTAEILEHLNLTYIGTMKNLQRCVIAGQTLASSDRSSKRWRRIVLTRLRLFPKGRTSPERVRPRGMPPEQVTIEVMQNLARMDEIIRQCESRFGGNRPIADHPMLGPLTAEEWRGFHVAHGKHHVRQILKLKQLTTPSRS